MLDSSKMGRRPSFRSKAAHFVSDLTTVFLNPISDKPSQNPPSPPPPSPSPSSPPENVTEPTTNQLELTTEDDSKDSVDGPDTSSFTAFLYSLLSSSETDNLSGHNDHQAERGELSSESVVKSSGGKKSLFSKGKQSLSKAYYHAARIGGYRSGTKDHKGNDGNDSEIFEEELMTMNSSSDPVPLPNLPDLSEPSSILSEKTRGFLYASLPALVQGRKWVLLYSTWRHGISLSTLYRRSMLWPGLSLLVVGDRKGAVFGGLVEAPLRPINKRRYQGTNNTFVFTNTPGHPVVFRPTGANRYFTLCSTDFLALGGGGHFALYLDADLLSGSSSVSETYGNPCLALSEDFEVKEVELWGFVYASKYEEVTTLCLTEAPGICRW